MHRPRQRAFTLIEILVVIGIIVILVGLLTVGLKMLSGSGGKTSTLTTMESMVAISNDLQTRLFPGGNTALNTTSPLFGTAGSSNSQYGVYTLAPGDLVGTGTTGDRISSPAVLATANLLSQAQASPDILAILNNLPASQTIAISPPANVWLQGWSYPNQALVAYIDPTANNALAWYSSSANGAMSTPPASPWGAASAGVTQMSRVVLDAWHNPMIYVPPGGLRGVIPSTAVQYNAGTTYQAGSQVTPVPQTVPPVAYVYINSVPSSGAPLPVAPAMFTAFWMEYIVRSPEVRNPNPNDVNNDLKSGRAFWASAGPDGNMNLGDDNVYSFQK